MRDAGQAGRGEGLLWNAFDRAPSLELFHAIKAAGNLEASLDRATGVLKATLAKAAAGEPRHASAATHDLLVQILTDGGRLSEAWQAVHAYGCSQSALNTLAGLSEGSFPHEALAAYARIVDSDIGRTSRNGYEAACALLVRMGRIRASLDQDAIHRDYLEKLATDHKAKRTFVQLLRAGRGGPG